MINLYLCKKDIECITEAMRHFRQECENDEFCHPEAVRQVKWLTTLFEDLFCRILKDDLQVYLETQKIVSE